MMPIVTFILSPWLTCFCQVWWISTQRFSLYHVHKLISLYVHCDLELWPVTSKINRVYSHTMANMSAKFDEEAHSGLVSFVFTSLLPYVYCDLDLWPLTSKIKMAHPLTMANMYAKFDEEAHSGLVSIVFTSLFPYMSIVTLTFDLWPLKSIGFILSSKWTCLPSLMKRHTTVQFLVHLSRRLIG